MSAIRRLHALGLVCLLALGFLLGSATPAQTFRGTILGTVTDTSGGAVVGAMAFGAVVASSVGRWRG